MTTSEQLNEDFDSLAATALRVKRERDAFETELLKLRSKVQGLNALADKWDSTSYAIEQVANPLLPEEQCAIELRAAIAEAVKE